tara:strand:+ start:46347 stop:46943 length:597 start_codon:yes stop_codon:yes gene_type:complete
MSELGQSIRQIRQRGEYAVRSNASILESPIGIKTPLEKGSSQSGESLFKMHYSVENQILDNLKNLIMTQKGERLGFPDFGTNLKEIYSITDLDEEQISDIASNEVQDAVNKFMPSVRLVEFYSKRLVSNDSELNFLNLIGSRFISKQNSNVNIDNVDAIEINKNNQFLDSVFKVIIKFNIPAISDKNSQIELFINTGK